jgi:hypothetical protein
VRHPLCSQLNTAFGGKRGAAAQQNDRFERRDAPLNTVLICCTGASPSASRQQPDGGGDTPGVAAAPVALAAVIVAGVEISIVMLSAHAAEFGVGITPAVGLMLVSPSCATVG